MMIPKKYTPIPFYKMVLLFFFAGLNSINATTGKTSSVTNQSLIEALFLADSNPKKIRQKIKKGISYYLNKEVLDQLISNLKINPQQSKEKIVKEYQEKTSKDQNSVNQYAQAYGCNTLNSDTWVLFETKLSKQATLTLSERPNSNKKIALNRLIKPTIKQKKEARWVRLTTLVASMQKSLTKEADKNIKEYLLKRDQKIPHKKIQHLLRRAGIKASLDHLFYNPKKVRYNNQHIEVNIANWEVEKGVSLSNYITITIPHSLRNRLKISSRLRYHDDLTGEQISMRLTGFIVYDEVYKQYIVYRVLKTDKGKIYFCYRQEGDGWNIKRVSMEKCRKALRQSTYLLYKRIKAIKINYTVKPEKKSLYTLRELATKLSFLANLILMSTYFVIWFYPEKSEKGRKGSKRKVPADIERGIPNDGFTCYFNGSLQVLADYLKPILEADLIDKQEDFMKRDQNGNLTPLPIGNKIQNKMRPALKKYTLHTIGYARNPNQASRTNTLNIIDLVNTMIDVGTISTTHDLITTQINTTCEEDESLREKNKELIENTENQQKEILAELQAIEKLLDAQKPIATIMAKIKKLTTFTNQVIKNLQEKWQGDDHSHINNIEQIKVPFQLGAQHDAQEFTMKFVDLLRAPRQLLWQTSNRVIYDDLGYFSKVLDGKQFTTREEGQVKKNVIFLPHIDKYLDPENSQLSKFIQTKLGDIDHNSNEKGIYFRKELGFIVQKIKDINPSVGKKMEEEYDKIKDDTLLPLQEYQDTKKKRLEVEKKIKNNKQVLKELQKKEKEQKEKQENPPKTKEGTLVSLEKYQETKKKRLEVEENVTKNENDLQELQTKEQKAWEDLQNSQLLRILRDMGLDMEKVKKGIKEMLTNREGSDIRFNEDEQSTPQKHIMLPLRVMIQPEKLVPQGDYILISPKIFEFITPTKSNKLPHQIFPDKELTFKESIAPNAQNVRYAREGLVVHSGGPTIQNGHYIAYRKFKGLWYKFNDDKVKRVGDGSEEALDKAIADFTYSKNMFGQKVKVKYGQSTYLYLYKKIEGQST